MNGIIPLEPEAIQYFRFAYQSAPRKIQSMLLEDTQKIKFSEFDKRAVIELLENLGEIKSAELFAQIMQRWDYDAEPWEKMAVVGFIAVNQIRTCSS